MLTNLGNGRPLAPRLPVSAQLEDTRVDEMTKIASPVARKRKCRANNTEIITMPHGAKNNKKRITDLLILMPYLISNRQFE